MVHSFIIFIENFAKEFFLEFICCPFVIYIIQFSRHLAEISDLKNEFYKIFIHMLKAESCFLRYLDFGLFYSSVPDGNDEEFEACEY